MNIGELFVKLGVVGDTSGLKKFGDGVDKVFTGVVNLKNVLGLATLYGMDRFVNSAVQGVVALQNLNNQTGLSIEQLKRWQIAGQMSNIAMTAGEISNAIGSLQKNLTAIRMGGGNVRPFQLLGIDIAGKDAFQVLEEIRKNIQGMDRSIATNIVTQTGLSPGFLNLLMQSRSEFEKLSNVRFFSPEQRERIQRIGQEVQKLKIMLSNFKDIMVASLYPVLSNIVKLLTNMANGFMYITEKVTGSKGAIQGLTVAFTGLAAVLFPVTTMIAGLLLLIDDFVKYMDKDFKGKTLFGRMFGEKPREFINWAAAPEKSTMETIGDLTGFNQIYDAIKGGISDLIKAVPAAAGAMTFNNNYEINSTADAREVAEEVSDSQLRQFKAAVAETNNGWRR